LLDQRLSTIPQHHWVSKLLGFDFRVEFRPGRQNIVADALSRRDVERSADLCGISGPQFSLFEDLWQQMGSVEELSKLKASILAGTAEPHWNVVDELITFKGRVYVPTTSPTLPTILAAAHTVGHEGIQKTLHRLRADFYVPQARKLVQEFVQACVTCQRNKGDHLHPAGLLQPLPVPEQIWADISMDFVEGFPRVHGKSVILTVVDRFSKYAHFIPLAHPYSAASVAKVFFDEVVRLHGIPTTIVSDRDPIFTSHF
jgi:hypothetical protein